MWRYPIVNCFFLVFFHYTNCCYCNQQHGLVNAKGETGTGYKRQLDLDEFNTPDFDIENSSKRDSESNSLNHESFNVDNITVVQTDNSTTSSPLPTDDMSITTVLENNVTETEELSSSSETSASSVYITTTESETNISTEISVLNYTSAVMNEISDINETSENTNISVSETNAVTTNETELMPNDPLYSELNLGLDQEVSMYCDKYKRTIPLNLNKMADIWRIAYYTMPQRLKCFKLHIKLLSTEDQQYYSKIYGNFNNRINWAKCDLEIMSRDNNNKSSNRKHFLQSIDSVSGVMKNIIIEEDISAKISSVALVEETPDQWFVVKNLLLMRDCTNGELVIFTRVPMEPKMIDIKDAINQFGGDRVINGTRACLS